MECIHCLLNMTAGDFRGKKCNNLILNFQYSSSSITIINSRMHFHLCKNSTTNANNNIRNLFICSLHLEITWKYNGKNAQQW